MQTRGLFVTGTDTDVGKTYVSALILRELAEQGVHVGAYKPACSGSVPDADGKSTWHDVEELSKAIGGTHQPLRICPQCFEAPLAPPVAARREQRTVDSSLLRQGVAYWEQRVEILVVEGVGGLLCPLTETETVADLAVDLGYPLIVVARMDLGTINHTLLTIDAAEKRGLRVAGIVMNQATANPASSGSEGNPSEIAARCDCPVLGCVEYGQTSGLIRDGQPVAIDWAELAAAPSTNRPDSTSSR